MFLTWVARRPRLARATLRTGLLAAVLAASLCSVSIGRSAGPSLTVAQYRTQAAAICRKATRQSNHEQPSDSGNLARDVEYEAKNADTAYRALARLKPPPKLARLNTEVLADLRVLLSGYTSLVRAAKKGKAELLRAIAQEPPRYAKLDKQIAALWIKLGVPACND